ncbi:hypothetical protein GTQ45_05010 [Pyruvatibacter mobilis]|uniref:Uncharacterized protein n=2 Tax=Pyruvatibacter mobilis TaxID=1712261 RepID=A0A845Q8U9_9HYPH|nr:type VI secretion system-associated protein TagO [Pyruvatibacter mobilis]NBG95085.1 hypothetical protein [Pyruvatibacter mobilis]QJD76274.1 hypothetical protein HG718_13240 [Pyruvatibacter mobilis]
MNDFRNLSFSVDSQEMVPSQFGFGGQYAKLTISCIENRTNIYVNWRRYITTGGIYNNHSVRYRIDKNSPRTEKWSMSTDYEATGKWRGSGISLIKRLKGASSFLLETTPYGDNTVRARFDIKGINQVVEQIANRCGWKP